MTFNPIKTLLGVLGLLLFAQNASSQSRFHSDLAEIRSLYTQHHVNPQPIDDVFSEQVFKQFIEFTDPNRLYFTQKDIVQLKKYRTVLDDEINGNTTGFLPFFTKLYKERLLKTEQFINQISASSFDLGKKKQLFLVRNDTIFPKEDAEALLLWEKVLKYRTLLLLVNQNKQTLSNLLPSQAAEQEARQKAKNIALRKIKRISEHPEGYETRIQQLFLEALSLRFDPHSMYMTATQMEDFMGSLSEKAFSFGMDLDENKEGEILIKNLVPGGSAWKSNELHKGDVLTGLKWQEKGFLDLIGADLEEVEDILKQSNLNKIELTVRKTDGTTRSVELVKTKIRAEENIVKSFMLTGNRKVGYISLPGFYGKEETETQSGCANDVAKEILKMKNEGIDGLILDLRFNGGGSLEEGLALSGIFIEEGPLLVMSQKGEKPQVLKDKNRGTVYDGPLLVLVNGQSASASEMTASVLQDYRRAVVVGSTTFGKATGQETVPLDSAIANNKQTPAGLSKNGKINFLHLTTFKFYRLSGKTVQGSGLQPDITIPDLYSVLNYKENTLPYTLPADSVNKKVYFSPLPPLPVSELRTKHLSRIHDHPEFTKITGLMTEIDKLYNPASERIWLDWESFVKWFEPYKALEKQMAALEKNKTSLQVSNLKANLALLTVDSYSKESNDLIIKHIQEDIYLEEACKIMDDLIRLWKK